MGRMSTIVQFFTSFSIIAGLLIIISSILATRLARTRQAVYFKILGAKGSFVLRVFAWENLLVGSTCALLAGLLAHTGSWLVCRQVFDIAYRPLPGPTLVMGAATLLPDLISVRFVKQHGSYNGGEVAVFPTGQAIELFRLKVAEPTVQPAVEVESIDTPEPTHKRVKTGTAGMGGRRG